MSNNLQLWIRQNKHRFDNPFDLAVACTSAFSLWGKDNRVELDIPSQIIKMVEQVWNGNCG